MNMYPSECEDEDNNIILNPPDKQTWPTHLTCPYCPSQAYPQMITTKGIDCTMRLYICPKKHKFYVEGEYADRKTEESPL